ncbi:MAG TPA: bifunctional precorrin-2 dehydrogenase/sirohydrochlorin ferrochelatase [Smithellaceae bacterium]|nr:bifunctional precorrin-2 dehydrogenase/sirohydrochlorin ferrochelatase [Smithellaceae bacterium]
MKYYPVFWNIQNKKCVVVGGGEVAARKVRRLLACGARVLVVSPQLTPELAALIADNSLEHVALEYHSRYLTGAVLVIGATDDENINDAVSRDARAGCIPVNIVDDPQKCDFILPSLVERGDLTIAIGTGGQSPALSRHLREELEGIYGEEYEVLLRILGKLRPRMKGEAGGKTWFVSLITSGVMDLIKEKDWKKVKKLVYEITGEEVAVE